MYWNIIDPYIVPYRHTFEMYRLKKYNLKGNVPCLEHVKIEI